MKQTNEQMNERVDNEILFSRTVKAGKRVYYIDVKRDRRDALYLAITESKRVKEGSVEERPVFEKHKIFLYREDMEKFMAAITAATDYAIEKAPVSEFARSEEEGEAGGEGNADFLSEEVSESSSLSDDKIKIDIDF